MGNGQKMKCELKGSVNMKLKNIETVKLNQSPVHTPSIENLLSTSRLVSKGAMIMDNQDKMELVQYWMKGNVKTKL